MPKAISSINPKFKKLMAMLHTAAPARVFTWCSRQVSASNLVVIATPRVKRRRGDT
jgi:hypothetical protein